MGKARFNLIGNLFPYVSSNLSRYIARTPPIGRSPGGSGGRGRLSLEQHRLHSRHAGPLSQFGFDQLTRTRGFVFPNGEQKKKTHPKQRSKPNKLPFSCRNCKKIASFILRRSPNQRSRRLSSVQSDRRARLSPRGGKM